MNDAATAVDGVIKRFGRVLALDDVSFVVPAGTVFGLPGPNGAGKTTRIRILTTILRPDSGRPPPGRHGAGGGAGAGASEV